MTSAVPGAGERRRDSSRFATTIKSVVRHDVTPKALFRDGTILDARHHMDELQSLRGMAALIVAVSHTSSIYAIPSLMRITIDAACNAHASIVVFCVRSVSGAPL
jgi:hypothetical protein